MKSFSFKQRIHVNIWLTQPFDIEAESEEEAIKIAKTMKDKDVFSTDYSNYESYSEMETIKLLDNTDGNPTNRIYHNGKEISHN